MLVACIGLGLLSVLVGVNYAVGAEQISSLKAQVREAKMGRQHSDHRVEVLIDTVNRLQHQNDELLRNDKAMLAYFDAQGYYIPPQYVPAGVRVERHYSSSHSTVRRKAGGGAGTSIRQPSRRAQSSTKSHGHGGGHGAKGSGHGKGHSR